MFDWFRYPPEKVEPFRPAFTGLMVWAVINLAVVVPFQLLGYGVLSFNLGLGLSALFAAGHVRFLVPRTVRQESAIGSLIQREKPDHPERSFCTDCGKKFVMRQRQSGFDPTTGKPMLSYQLGCPDGDPGKETKEYEHYRRALIAGGGFGRYDGQQYQWPDCGSTKIVPLTPVGHLNHQPADTSTECPKCIELMLIDGIIDMAAAKKLVRALGRVE